MTQSQLGKFDDASKNFVRAEGEVKGRINMANRLEVAGRSEEALKQFEAASLHAAAEAKSNTKVEPITVVMEIKNGFVTYASVSNPRPGMSAYENTALRIARQRRFPSNKNGKGSDLHLKSLRYRLRSWCANVFAGYGYVKPGHLESFGTRGPRTTNTRGSLGD